MLKELKEMLFGVEVRVGQKWLSFMYKRELENPFSTAEFDLYHILILEVRDGWVLYKGVEDIRTRSSKIREFTCNHILWKDI
jgi:hypothetical protein